MSLWDSSVMFLFLEATDLPRSRFFLKDVLDLKLLEDRFHPPHERHGVAKYDAGNVILALNLAVKTFNRHASDGLVTVFGTEVQREALIYARLHGAGLSPPAEPGGTFFDPDNHGFAILSTKDPTAGEGSEASLRVEELRFDVEDLGAAVAFYNEILGLPLLHRAEGHAVLESANLRFVLTAREESVDLPVRNDGVLTVFSTPQIERTYESLAQRGLDFRNRKVRYSEIGGTVRFRDPTGHAFCLYSPSEESLDWESGPKVRELMTYTERTVPQAVN